MVSKKAKKHTKSHPTGTGTSQTTSAIRTNLAYFGFADALAGPASRFKLKKVATPKKIKEITAKPTHASGSKPCVFTASVPKAIPITVKTKETPAKMVMSKFMVLEMSIPKACKTAIISAALVNKMDTTKKNRVAITS